MQTIDYISNDVKPLGLEDKIMRVKQIFSQHPHSHLPVIDKNIFCGSIARQDIEYMEDDDKLLNHFKNRLRAFYTSESVNWFEVLEYFARYNTNLIPVLNIDKVYLGYYELDDFLNIFKCTPFIHEEGVIFVISKNIKEYSFSEISQIIESNKATLFGAFVSKIENDVIQITLKLSLHDINNTLNSFRRYNYNILNEFEKDKYLEDLNDRSNYLQKYLNI